MLKTGLKGNLFAFDINSIDTNDILHTHIYLMKKRNIKKILGIIKKCLLYY